MRGEEDEAFRDLLSSPDRPRSLDLFIERIFAWFVPNSRDRPPHAQGGTAAESPGHLRSGIRRGSTGGGECCTLPRPRSGIASPDLAVRPVGLHYA
jgi:hypothetical protein